MYSHALCMNYIVNANEIVRILLAKSYYRHLK